MNYEERDPLSLDVFRTLTRVVGCIQDRRLCEAGSGSGKISLWLAAAGARVTLVDLAPEALQRSRQAFQAYKLPGRFIEADIRRMPFPDASFDVTWNAGVLEHFSTDEQVVILREMARVTRRQGLVLVCTPNAKCLPYRLGKYVAEQRGLWPYGVEVPISTHRDIFQAAGLTMTCEISIAAPVGFDFFNFLGEYGRQLRVLALQWWSSLSDEEKATLPGYLIVGVGIVP